MRGLRDDERVSRVHLECYTNSTFTRIPPPESCSCRRFISDIVRLQVG